MEGWLKMLILLILGWCYSVGGQRTEDNAGTEHSVETERSNVTETRTERPEHDVLWLHNIGYVCRYQRIYL